MWPTRSLLTTLMSNYASLREIMDDIREDDSHVVVEEQHEETTREEHGQLTDLQEALIDQRRREDEQADREPAELGREV